METALSLVGTGDIAEWFGVSYKTVQKWTERAIGFPAPAITVRNQRLWNESDIEAWGLETGRLAK